MVGEEDDYGYFYDIEKNEYLGTKPYIQFQPIDINKRFFRKPVIEITETNDYEKPKMESNTNTNIVTNDIVIDISTNNIFIQEEPIEKREHIIKENKQSETDHNCFTVISYITFSCMMLIYYTIVISTDEKK